MKTPQPVLPYLASSQTSIKQSQSRKRKGQNQKIISQNPWIHIGEKSKVPFSFESHKEKAKSKKNNRNYHKIFPLFYSLGYLLLFVQPFDKKSNFLIIFQLKPAQFCHLMSRPEKMYKLRQLSLSQFVYFVREVCLLFNFEW